MLIEDRRDWLLALGALASLFFLVVGTVSLVIASNIPRIHEPVGISIGAASLFLSVVSGSATFAGWMNSTRNRFMANLIFQTFDECGPQIEDDSLREATKQVFEGIRTTVKEKEHGLLYKVSHWRELRQQLGEFDDPLFDDAKQRLRFEGYILKNSNTGRLFWKSIIVSDADSLKISEANDSSDETPNK